MKKIILLSFIFLGINSSLFAASLNGNYTIGSSGNYTDFSSAVNDLINNGVSGPVTFNVDPGLYQEQLIIPQIVGASGLNRITFMASSTGKGDVTLESTTSHSAANYVVKLNGANDITFSGITFKSPNLDYGRVFHIDNGSNGIIWDGNYLEAQEDLLKYGDSLALVYVPLSNGMVHNLTFTANEFIGGSYGVFAETNTVSDRAYNYLFKGNKFEKHANGALYITGMKGLNIKSNKINLAKGVAINLSFNDSILNIDHNKINSSSVSGSTGITINGHALVKNQGELKIYNNIIQLNTGIGLSITNVKYGHIYHNSIYTTNNSTYYNFSVTNCDSNQVKNNMFINNGTEKAMNWDSGLSDTYIDHNVYYSSGTTVISFQGSLNFGTISNWTSSSNQDNNSIKLLPPFKDLSTLEMKCDVANVIQNGSSSLGFSINTDYEGRVRQATPWIGALELYVPDDNPININGYVYNGTDTIKSGHIEVYGDTSNRKVLDYLGNADINPDGSYNLSDIPAVPMYIQIFPNSSLYPDFLVSFHDSTIRAENSVMFDPDNCNGLVKDIHPRKLETIIHDGEGVIQGTITLNSGGSNKTLGNDPIPGLDVVLDKIPPTKSVAKTKTNSLGEYTFSGLPIGTYLVSIEYNGLKSDTVYEVDVNGVDTLHEELNYCVDTTTQIEGCFPTSVNTNEENIFEGKVYPNPFHSSLIVSNNEVINRIKMFDLQGKEVLDQFVNSTNITVDTQKIGRGIYMLRIFIDDKVVDLKVMK